MQNKKETMAKKQVEKPSSTKEEMNADDLEVDGDELFDGLESMSKD